MDHMAEHLHLSAWRFVGLELRGINLFLKKFREEKWMLGSEMQDICRIVLSRLVGYLLL
jgi:hypothetical protein